MDMSMFQITPMERLFEKKKHFCDCCTAILIGLSFCFCVLGSILIGGYSLIDPKNTAFAHLVCAEVDKTSVCNFIARRSGARYVRHRIALMYGPHNTELVCGCAGDIFSVDLSICENGNAIWLRNFYSSFSTDQCDINPKEFVNIGIGLLSAGVLCICILLCYKGFSNPKK